MYGHNTGRRRSIGAASITGITLIEMLVTISLLGGLMAGTLTLYSNITATNRQHDAVAGLLAEADRIMAVMEQDVRLAADIDVEYALAGGYSVLAALPRLANGRDGAQTIVYALDAEQPRRLYRLTVTDRVHATELTSSVKDLSMIHEPEGLLTVELTLERLVAGKSVSWQSAAAFSTL